MLSAAAPSIYQAPKCFATYGTMGHVDPKQAPHRGKPWSAIMSQDFIHKVDLVLPSELFELVFEKVIETRQSPQYSKVTMTLGDILEGDFFTEYIKKGNVIMLSEGKMTASSLFTLHDGTLLMYLDKEVYERAGLVGKPYGAKGGRGLRPRWVVSFDLRSPAMLRGKKGFDRLIYACKNVLNQPTTWLFANVDESTPCPDPLQRYFPASFTSSPGITRDLVVVQGPLDIASETLANADRSSFEEGATECYEWLSLIRLGSPRVEPQDNIDPYLSRYQVPGDAEGQVSVCKLSWQGFVSSVWLHKLLVGTVAACPSTAWFSLSASCFSKHVPGGGDEIMILRPPVVGAKYLMWEINVSE
ncbi:ribonuclease P 40kDa subunit [Dactylonectria macrodidyma]|uniref:Ribonuclease P 40kDa subunit n=1 Tax=Dactylonectria macrodidyma TaxID=307937 RepID=A0A9P9ESD9_9HYPO|nr:ribonuclease P 40kDa subunit [Dactylonectria macrodidyma]